MRKHVRGECETVHCKLSIIFSRTSEGFKEKKKILYLHLSHRAARKFHTSFLKFIIYKKFRDHTRAKS